MLIFPQSIKIKWHQRYRNYYEMRGYIFTAYRDEFEVNVVDLPISSNKKVWVYCDYCYIKVQKKFQCYIKQKEKSIIKKDCCYDCRPIKTRESNKMNYGVESTNQLHQTIEKRNNTNIKTYGGENVMASERVREKVAQTNIQRYGFKTPAQNEIVKAKIKNTNILKYGFVSPTQNEEIRIKQLTKMLEKYNVEYGMQSEEILNKARNTLYENGNAPISRQQRYIWQITGGEINYPFKNYSLDIAIADKKIYIECDFGGHWLQIKLGNKTEEEFKSDERKRYYSLYRNDWKSVRIISKSDKVPSREKVHEIIEVAYYYLLSGHSWINFDLDKSMVICSDYKGRYDFGTLFYPYQLEL
ncbi:hypothetical protein ACIQYS_15835 [Psychrobacillus sp. NPDC096426]|uniref:DUF7487 domain-containing protein n=1 Tax=Psychrobacillus sp. NPDC096426 TaxID=3364491 RepID=UPI00381DB36E